MDSNLISTISRKVTKEFPEFAGCRPVITPLSGDKFTLIYSTIVKTESGASLPRTLRLTVDSRGKIIKKSTSR